ncbi:glycosyltransferase family 2 protein [Maribacter polysaccharolyticus]|uniref:glycosyltransferase family 2 protein n=1 Tax=Maribacter polysaccharolyticus TaxID=3020831 RepID=UPI00237FA4E3|nr:glycosyltransferase family 2 protein [Maribacter polysaccharolyticus]MDE3743515.1 glycosyltransferase family 2 protein [Maribacter polysaccharolyticus]
MKVSIITGTYNSEKYIGDCLSSIFMQDYPDIEHIIIDGSSKDRTLKVIKNTKNRVSKVISEPDEGIYDAMNKGIRLAQGEIIGILNSDDFYNSNSVISTVVKAFKESQADCIYGNLYYVKPDDPSVVVRKWVTGPYNEKYGFRWGWHPAHPSFFVRKDVYEKYGCFQTDHKISADFELMLRFIERFKVKTSYLEYPMVRMRLGGESSSGLKSHFIGNKECYRAFKRNNIPIPWFYPIVRVGSKLNQYFNH